MYLKDWWLDENELLINSNQKKILYVLHKAKRRKRGGIGYE